MAVVSAHGVVLEQIASASCTASTVTTLRQILLPSAQTVTANDNKENLKSRTGRSTARLTASSKTTAAGRGRTQVKLKAVAVEESVVTEHLNPREKLEFAFGVVNSALKSLSQALKSNQGEQAQDLKPTSPIKPLARTPSSLSQRALKSRSPNRQKAVRSIDETLSHGPPAGIVCAAECARAAFAYIRTHQSNVDKRSTDLQVENGMLALIGKCMAHGLANLAVKELNILKKRLDAHIKGGTIEEACDEQSQGIQGDQQEGEALVNLLKFEDLGQDSSVIPLVINHQLAVLKLLAFHRRPKTIEACWGNLSFSSPSSPICLILRQAQGKELRNKSARQLEAVAQALLSFCPHVASYDDVIAKNSKLSIPPDVAIRYQCLAFQTRFLWWHVATHKPEIEREFWLPFSKCLATFTRRAKTEAIQKYELLVTLFNETETGLQECLKGLKNLALLDDLTVSQQAVYRSMSQLAQEAQLTDEAMRWTRAFNTVDEQACLGGAETAASAVRMAALGLRSSNGEQLLQQALKCLSGSLKGDASALDSLLLEVASLRRSAIKVVADETKRTSGGKLSSMGQCCCDALFGCNRFLIRYLGSSPSSEGDPRDLVRYHGRVTMAEKVIKGFLESAMLCCKIGIQTDPLQWDAFDAALQDCHTLVQAMQGDGSSNEEKVYLFHQDLQFPMVKLSNLYWGLYLQRSRAAQADKAACLHPLQRSVEVLRKRTLSEKSSGLFIAKLERLADFFYDSAHYSKALQTIREALCEHIAAGVLRSAADSAAIDPLHPLDDGKDPASLLIKTLRRMDQIITKIDLSDDGDECFDDPELPPDERGLLLEWQLNTVGQRVMRNRQSDSSLLANASYMIHTLFGIYSIEHFPIRRLRVAVLASRLIAQHNSLLHDDLARILEECEQRPASPFGQDRGLQRFLNHLLAMEQATAAMRATPINIEKLQTTLVAWNNILASPTSLSSKIEDVPTWLAQLTLIADFFDAQGMLHLEIPTLDLLLKAMELDLSRNTSSMLIIMCRTSCRYLRLGYSGKAGLILEKAKALLSHEQTGNLAKLRWYVTDAEYLLSIGALEKCGAVLGEAETMAKESPELTTMAGPTATLSSRIGVKRLLADAAYVYSLLSLETGRPDAAFKFARACAKLNQSTWSSLESRKRADHLMSTSSSTDTEMESLSKSMNGLSTSMHSARLPVMSMTHDSLRGSEFWYLVSGLLRGMSLLSRIYDHHGLFLEAVYHAEQAKRVANAVMSNIAITSTSSVLSELLVKSGRVEQGQEHLNEAVGHVQQLKPSHEMVACKSAAARMWRAREEEEDEIECYDEALRTIEQLDAPSPVHVTENTKTSEDILLADKLAGLQIGATSASIKSTKGRKAAVKTPAKSRKATAIKAVFGAASSANECVPLQALRAKILLLKANSLLQSGEFPQAAALIKEAETHTSVEGNVMQAVMKFRLLVHEATKQIASNLTFSALPESTIALPALSQSRRHSSHQVDENTVLPSSTSLAKPKRAARGAKTSAQQKTSSSRVVASQCFANTLQLARDCLAQIHALSLHVSSLSAFCELSGLLGSLSMLLSATEHILPKAQVHPVSASFYLDLPRIRGSDFEQSVLRIENETQSKETFMQWPSSTAKHSQSPETLSAAQFKEDYIDILPASWSAVSMSLNDAKDELLITRYRCGQSPFILRLPMARHKSRDLDEEIFDFEAGRTEMREIVDLTNFSAHDARDMSKKGAKSQWWAEREAMDLRLKELLINIENIWLGGFRGIFAQQRCEEQALANFQAELQKILHRHLPSRQGKGSPKTIKFEPRILELFTGLGDPDSDDIDLYEPLMDLMYFLVDILQFNGERNAYDEIDFDEIAVETIDALKVYHSSASSNHEEDGHTVLVLDKHLHGFPWESIPALRNLSVSRLPSLASLRQRITTMRASRTLQKDMQPEGHFVHRSSGASILNPSGDLKNTQQTFQPLLNSLPSSWSHISSALDEKGFSSILAENELLLYFGHGSGAQYIRHRAVKKLGASNSTESPIASCSTTWLMGCSSAAVTENGDFEPNGMVLAYLSAGSPAVVGALWDVTDKDCDRAAVKIGEDWGLWDTVDMGSSTCKGKGKQKDVEKARGATVAARRKLFEPSNSTNALHETSDPWTQNGTRRKVSLTEAVTKSRDACYLKYLNGAALVVYGIPVYLSE